MLPWNSESCTSGWHHLREGFKDMLKVEGPYVGTFLSNNQLRLLMEISCTIFFPLPTAADQTHQICTGHDPRSVRFCAIWETSNGVAQSLQRQESSEVHKEKGECRAEQLGGSLSVCQVVPWRQNHRRTMFFLCAVWGIVFLPSFIHCHSEQSTWKERSHHPVPVEKGAHLPPLQLRLA